jgi:heme A synthase
MNPNDAALSKAETVEVAFPAWPLPLWAARALAPAAPRAWATQREAGAAAAVVAAFVGVPAVVAVATVLTTFVLASAVLFAPLVAIALSIVAWHYNRRSHAPPAPVSAGK